tara:strand:+ start:81 stop:488 length:408 start_codon:yes stop_codon:yes gene_type:complete
MRLFIRIRDGQPFKHPLFEDNFRQAFPDVDVDNLPEGFAAFERGAVPAVGTYQTREVETYEKVGGIYTDVHKIREMTEGEVAAKQQGVKDAWAIKPNRTSWVFNEETCSYDPPFPRPDDGAWYAWNEETTSWIEV